MTTTAPLERTDGQSAVDPLRVVADWAAKQLGLTVAIRRFIGAAYVDVATVHGTRAAIEVLDHPVPMATLALRQRAHQAAGRDVTWIFTGAAHPRRGVTSTHLIAATGAAPVIGLDGSRVTCSAPAPRDGLADCDLMSMRFRDGRVEPAWWDLAADADAEHRDAAAQRATNTDAITYAVRLEQTLAGRRSDETQTSATPRRTAAAATAPRTGTLPVRYERYTDPVRPPRPGDPGCGGCGGRLDPALFASGYHFGCETPEQVQALAGTDERAPGDGTAPTVPHTHSS